jgi:hypothetical protein
MTGRTVPTSISGLIGLTGLFCRWMQVYDVSGQGRHQCPGEIGVARGRRTSGIMKRAATKRPPISMIASL